MKLVNSIRLHKDYVEVIVENGNYRHSVLLDIEDLAIIGKMKVSNTGYAYQARLSGKSVASIIMNVQTSNTCYIDHINGNSLDNRKVNLRICTPSENARNRKRFTRNNTGKVGIAYRKNGEYEYYRCSVTDLKGIRQTKQFNINKLGKSQAFQYAEQWLNDRKQEYGYIV